MTAVGPFFPFQSHPVTTHGHCTLDPFPPLPLHTPPPLRRRFSRILLIINTEVHRPQFTSLLPILLSSHHTAGNHPSTFTRHPLSLSFLSSFLVVLYLPPFLHRLSGLQVSEATVISCNISFSLLEPPSPHVSSLSFTLFPFPRGLSFTSFDYCIAKRFGRPGPDPIHFSIQPLSGFLFLW